jgi:predicted negative regulator of RcsB-dependent stress response
MAEEYLTDDEQLEAVKHWISEYAPWLIGGVLVGASAFLGIQYYRNHVTDRALQAGTQFALMTDALAANNPAKSRQVAEVLIKDYASTPYADQAQLILAKLAIDDGVADKAVGPLTQVMNESKDADLRQIARLRLARALTDQGKADEAIKLLADPIPVPFAAPYHEARGDAYLSKKDTAHALGDYQAALAAADPAGMNAALLELKIQDVSSPAAPLAKAVPVETPNKAKP